MHRHHALRCSRQGFTAQWLSFVVTIYAAPQTLRCSVRHAPAFIFQRMSKSALSEQEASHSRLVSQLCNIWHGSLLGDQYRAPPVRSQAAAGLMPWVVRASGMPVYVYLPRSESPRAPFPGASQKEARIQIHRHSLVEELRDSRPTQSDPAWDKGLSSLARIMLVTSYATEQHKVQGAPWP